MSHWQSKGIPGMRKEVMFGSRVVDCFIERPATLYQMWQNAVSRHPDRDAVVHAGRRWSYAQADMEVNAISAGLASRGLVRGDRFALLLANSPIFIFALFALQRLGAIAVPISTREQSLGVGYMLDQCEAKGILFDADLHDRIGSPKDMPSVSLKVVNGTLEGFASLSELCAATSDVSLLHQSEPEDTAIILYTSGTTGQPKGAMLTHINLAHSARHFELAMGLSCEDRAGLVVPATHVTGLVAIVATMVHVSGACVISPPFKAAELLAFMAAEGVTYTIMVPAMYSLILLAPEFDQADLHDWRVGAYGGAPMPVNTIAELARKLPNLALMNAYGATETTSPTTISPVGSDVEHADSIGVPLPCASVRVMNEAGQEVPRGEAGELWISGPMVVPGYWKNPSATDASFTAGYWHSGDIGSVDADGFVHIVDRKKDMLSRGGFKIYSVEVENRLTAYPGVLEAAVIGKPCPVLGERVHAFLYAPGLSRNDEILQRHCAEVLADYKVPESFFWSNEPLPRNANGKLVKRTLRERLLA